MYLSINIFNQIEEHTGYLIYSSNSITGGIAGKIIIKAMQKQIIEDLLIIENNILTLKKELIENFK